MRRVALELVHEELNGQGGIALDTQVDVIGHNFKGVYRGAQLLGLLMDEGLQITLNTSDEYGAPILGAPHQVVRQAVDGPGMAAVAFGRHAASISDSCQLSITGKEERVSSVA
jgi:hypothetical protein